jgi:hypothetical protein
MIPLIPSPGSPKIVSTSQSMSRSTRASAAILANVLLLLGLHRLSPEGRYSRPANDCVPRSVAPKLDLMLFR